MTTPLNIHRPLGTTGIVVPPIAFRVDVLGCSTLPDRTKRLICGEWIQRLNPPIFMDVVLKEECNLHLETLGRMFAHLDVTPEEVVINFELAAVANSQKTSDPHLIRQQFDNARALLGPPYLPRLVTVRAPAEDGPAGSRTFDLALPFAVKLLDGLQSLKIEHELAAVGIALDDWRLIELVRDAAQFDFIKLLSGPTVQYHPQEMSECLANLAARSIPTITANVFHGGFLVGGSTIDGCPANSKAPSDESLRTWRKAFTSLCHGHGVRPAHACIQFALGMPGVIAVSLNTTRIERVAENVEAATTPVPSALWHSMKEEGLLAPD